MSTENHEHKHRQVTRILPPNLSVVNHVASGDQSWFARLITRVLGSDGYPVSRPNIVCHLDCPDEKDLQALSRKALKLARQRVSVRGSKKTQPLRKVELVIYDPPGTEESEFNAPLRIGADGRFSSKPMEVRVGKRVYRR